MTASRVRTAGDALESSASREGEAGTDGGAGAPPNPSAHRADDGGPPPSGDPPTNGNGLLDRLPRLSFLPPRWAERGLDATIIGLKTVTVVCAIDAVVNANSPRFAGKGSRTRAIGYGIGLAVVPVIWRMLPDRGRYPRGLDAAVTVPLLIDAAGNSLGLYEEAHLDDVVHFLNAAIVAGVAGALFATRTDDPLEAALAGTGSAIAGETFWEIAEYLGLKAGARGMDLTYDDTMADLAESAAGAVVGGMVTWLRMPRAKEERRRGWRVALGGWRDSGEPVSLGVPPGSVADRVLRRRPS
jgi:hypothetical protein